MNSHKKTIVMGGLCVAIAIMAIAYAAFSTTLNVNGTTSNIGTFSVVLTGCACSGTAGVSGGTTPTGSCTPASTATATAGTVTANLAQPGDVVTCTFNVKNAGNLKAKANGNYSCSPSALSSPFTSSVTWKKTSLAASATSTTEITITIGYLSTITTQPSTTSASITCTFPYTQDI